MAKRLAIGAAVVALGVVVVLVQRGVRPEFVLILGVIGALFAARIRRDRGRVLSMSADALRRRAVRGLAITLPFAAAALVIGLRETSAESAEDAFTRIILVVPCSLFAGWFASGAVAPGYAWIRSRRAGGGAAR